jgi:peptidoglycan biosynthesis protein MviN/MurJ (putative lipid II flippase)
MRRVAFRTLLIVGLPAYIVFRVAAEWLYSKEPDDFDPAWIGIGYLVSDIGALVFLIALVLAGIATRKGTGWLTKTSGVLSAILVVGLVIAIWAMGAKPT